MAFEVDGFAPLIQVFDMPRSLAFYRDVLGFQLVMPAGAGDEVDWVLLRLGEIELMLNTAYEKPDRPPAPDPARVAAHRDIGLFFGCRDLDGAYAHLRTHGISVTEPKIAAYGMRQIWLEDPDGYVICFQWPAA